MVYMEVKPGSSGSIHILEDRFTIPSLAVVQGNGQNLSQLKPVFVFCVCI
jgi:hypothetical protein